MDVDIEVEEQLCVRCGKCVKWCPEDAILVEDLPIIDFEKCVHCGECMNVCPKGVFDVAGPRPNEAIYEDFSEVYSSGKYPEFSRAMADLFTELMEDCGVDGREILDLACGEGTFAVEISEKGYDVVGVDISSRQITFAREKDSGAEFMVDDIRELSFSEEFDAVTCWYDSLNYILDREELKQVFEGVHSALREGGIFVFDVNTVHVMEEVWNEQTMVKEDSSDRFDMVEQNYDEEERVTSLKLTSFLREDSSWRKIEEVHKERAYSFEELREIFDEVGFEESASWKDIRERKEIDEETERAWFVLAK